MLGKDPDKNERTNKNLSLSLISDSVLHIGIASVAKSLHHYHPAVSNKLLTSLICLLDSFKDVTAMMTVQSECRN